MKIYTTPETFPDDAKGSIIAIGNFDGIHLGHQAMIDQGRAMAQKKGLKFGILTFEPHPRKLFRPDDPPFRLTPFPVKQRLLEEHGVDFVLSLSFNWDFASQSAETFVGEILQKHLQPAHILIGSDFHFGQLRKGSLETIRSAGLAVTGIPPVCNSEGLRYSSTAIREALMAGDVGEANKLLGRDWEIEGVIFRGDRRGHELGYPTANILLGDILHPAYGVYASRVMVEGEDIWRPAATNIGIRPMFEVKEGQLEAHILDFEDRDIYDKALRVKLLKRLRGEAKFPSLQALINQIAQDCEQARSILSGQ